MKFLHPLQWLSAAREMARRGRQAAPIDPARRRLVLLQIDGLSSRRLRQAMARGDMPHLKRWLDSGRARLHCLTAGSEPSTPVFTAGLLYGARDGVPGFAWYDRRLGRSVRMDLAEDVSALERTLSAGRRPLLDGGVSYGTIWPGGAADAFFNVVLFAHGATSTGKIVSNAWDKLVSTLAGVGIAGRLTSRFFLELGVGLWDFVRWCRRIRSTRFEWRFLYMRLFVSVVMRDVATQGAVVDVLRGVPRVFIDFLGYDEYAHRRGPDAELALYNLTGIDGAIGRIRDAVASVPEYNYDVFVLSDHGQSATKPFSCVEGKELLDFVLSHAGGSARGLTADHVRDLVALRASEMWTRTLPKGLRGTARLYVSWLRRRLRRAIADDVWHPLDGLEVVTGGSVAHIYCDRRAARRLTVEEIEARHPELLRALAQCRAVGLMVGRGSDGPIVFHRGRRYRLSGDRALVSQLEPFRVLGYDVLAAHLRQAADGQRHGDLVLYGAFAEAGNIAFDFEFGSHGGIGPEELDQFMITPAEVALPDELRARAVPAEAFYRFFAARYADATDGRRAGGDDRGRGGGGDSGRAAAASHDRDAA